MPGLIDIINTESNLAAETMKPSKLIAVYENNKSIYMEVAKVNNQGKPGTFRPLTDALAIEMAEAITHRAGDSVEGLVPDGLKYFAYNQHRISKLAWVTPPSQQYLRFNSVEDLKNGTYKVPWIFWLFTGYVVHVFSMLENPTPETLIYHAPFYNVYANGEVCMGAGQKLMKGKSLQEYVKNIEKAFWKTDFTHAHCTRVINAPEKNMTKAYSKILNSQAEYTKDNLMPFIPKEGKRAGQKPFMDKETQMTYAELLHFIAGR